MTPSTRRTGDTILAGVVFLVAVAGYVLLTVTGYHDATDGLVVIVGPVIAAMFLSSAIGSRIDSRTAGIAESVETVRKQTNGVLDERINTVVRAALADYTVATSTPGASLVPPAPDEGPGSATLAGLPGEGYRPPGTASR